MGKNSQDAEGDILVRVVGPIVVHVREAAIVEVTDDDAVIGAVGFASASCGARVHPYGVIRDRPASRSPSDGALFGGCPHQTQARSSVIPQSSDWEKTATPVRKRRIHELLL